VPLAVDPAEARLAPAAAEGAVAWVEKEAVVLRPAVATAEVRKLAVVVAEVAMAAVAVAEVEDDEDKQNDRGKNNENKINNYDVVENFS